MAKGVAVIFAALILLGITVPNCECLDRVIIFTFLNSDCDEGSLKEVTFIPDRAGCQSAITIFPALLANTTVTPRLRYVQVADVFSSTGNYTIFEQDFNSSECTGFSGPGSASQTVPVDECTQLTNFTWVVVSSAPVAIIEAEFTPEDILHPESIPDKVFFNVSTPPPGILPTESEESTVSFNATNNNAVNAVATTNFGILTDIVRSNVTLYAPVEFNFTLWEIFWNVSASQNTTDCQDDNGEGFEVVLQFFDYTEVSPGQVNFTYQLGKQICNVTNPVIALDSRDTGAAAETNQFGFAANVSFTISRIDETAMRFALNVDDNVLAWANLEVHDTEGNSVKRSLEVIPITLVLFTEPDVALPAPLSPLAPVLEEPPSEESPVTVAPSTPIGEPVAAPVTVPPLAPVAAPLTAPPVLPPLAPLAPVTAPPVAPVAPPVTTPFTPVALSSSSTLALFGSIVLGLLSLFFI